MELIFRCAKSRYAGLLFGFSNSFSLRLNKSIGFNLNKFYFTLYREELFLNSYNEDQNLIEELPF